MAYAPIKTDELKKLVMSGKRHPMNFAYNPGPKDDDLLIVDRKKSPDVIGRTAKKEGEGTKVAYGTFVIDAKKMQLTAEQALPGMSKKLRKYMKKIGFSFSIEVLDSSGNLIDADQDEAEAEEVKKPDQTSAAQADGQEKEAVKAPDTTDLKERMRAVAAPISALGPKAEPLKQAFAQALADFKSGKIEKSDKLLGKIEDSLAMVDAKKAEASKNRKEAKENGGAPSVDPKAIIARATSLKKDVETLQGKNVQEIKTALAASLTLLKAGKFAAADEKLTSLEAVINALPPQESQTEDKSQGPDANNEASNEAKAADTPDKAETSDAAQDKTDNVIDYTKSRQAWINTRTGLQADLVKLKIAIDAQTRGVEGLEDISQNTDVLLDYIDELDASLEKTLTQLTQSAQGPERDKLKAEAIGIITLYRNTLDTDFFKAVDGNGFTDTSIRSTALDALKGVEATLAA